MEPRKYPPGPYPTSIEFPVQIIAPSNSWNVAASFLNPVKSRPRLYANTYSCEGIAF